ncbi:type III-A CRISPR-associated protein Csm2 [candidate division KSB1 bacterium]
MPETLYFFEDQKKEVLKESLLTDRAVDWARKFIRPEDRQETRLSSAQLRRFYSDVKSLSARVNEQDFSKFKPIVKMLKSKVAYACPRTNVRDRKVPLSFKVFIDEMVDNVDDYRDFKAFCSTFEAVVGYFYGEGGR